MIDEEIDWDDNYVLRVSGERISFLGVDVRVDTFPSRQALEDLRDTLIELIGKPEEGDYDEFFSVS